MDKKNDIVRKKLQYQKMMHTKNLTDDNKRQALQRMIDKLDDELIALEGVESQPSRRRQQSTRDQEIEEFM